MERTTIATQRVASTQTASGTKTRRAELENSSQDPFLQIVQSMMETMAENDDTLQTILPKQSEEEILPQTTMQDVSAMMFLTPTPFAQMMLEQPQTFTVNMEQANQIQPIQTTLNPAQNLAVTVVIPPQIEQPLAQPFKPLQDSVQAIVPEQLKSSPNGMTVETLWTPKPQSTEQTPELFAAQRQWKDTVETVKRNLQQQEEQPASQTAQTLEPREVKPFELTQKKAEAVAQQPKVAEQLKQGIAQNLSKQTGEFTMKLKPEALGEVTIKMVKVGEKMTIQIVTASKQACQLINQDLPALREAVRPLQAEVQEALPLNQTNTQQTTQFDLSGQSFAQQHKAFAQQPSKHTNAALPVAEENVEEEQDVAQQNGVHIYI